MRTDEFHYELPEHLIAQEPLPDRSSSRLLVLSRRAGTREHTVFHKIVDYLEEGDLLVLNDSKVLPARLIGQRPTGGHCEFLLLHPLGNDRWRVLAKPAKKLLPGRTVYFGDGQLTATIDAKHEEGQFDVHFTYAGSWHDILHQLGNVPLPPYIRRALDHPERYQTVYARHEGSVAAPTAGLHFTDELLGKIRAKGVEIASITLHVGVGTFRPVKTEYIQDHKMHAEYFFIPPATEAAVAALRKRGGRLIAVGTTVTRTLEANAADDGTIQAGEGWSDLFIYPGYVFRAVDGLITNFHLPSSTLLMLVSAFAGKERILAAYREAIEMEYRFFSFGDAMLIV